MYSILRHRELHSIKYKGFIKVKLIPYVNYTIWYIEQHCHTSLSYFGCCRLKHLNQHALICKCSNIFVQYLKAFDQNDPV